MKVKVMRVVIFILLILFLQGCNSPGDCIELTNGSGRTGVYIEFAIWHQVRMDDSGNALALNSGDFIVVNCSNRG